jgi:hypothetical protein
MTTATTTYDDRAALAPPRRRMLRRMIAGAAVFDAAMGVACLAAASDFSSSLSISSAAVRETGVVFLVAALVGAETTIRPSIGVRWIVAANAAFAVWCLAVLGFDGPDAIGATVLAVAAACSAGTALVEHRMAASAR